MRRLHAGMTPAPPAYQSHCAAPLLFPVYGNQGAVDHLVSIGFLLREDLRKAGGVNLFWGLLLQEINTVVSRVRRVERAAQFARATLICVSLYPLSPGLHPLPPR